MALKSTAVPVAEITTAWENPLIPNKRLRELYTAMVEMRLLEQHIAKLQRRAKASERMRIHYGEEGCFVSTVLSLKAGDRTSEASRGLAIEFLDGAKLSMLIASVPVPRKRSSRELPAIEDAAGRLYLAIGAAIVSSAKTKGALVVAYIHAGELAIKNWKPLLQLAATEAAPILFVVLPGAAKAAKAGQLSHAATSFGVPGIPVDVADPVALYRVAQEAMLRARAGGGPVLMECIPFQIAGQRAEAADPILTMRQFMLPRGVANEDWFESVAARFSVRLKAIGK